MCRWYAPRNEKGKAEPQTGRRDIEFTQFTVPSVPAAVSPIRHQLKNE
jgi:hypothetical protein